MDFHIYHTAFDLLKPRKSPRDFYSPEIASAAEAGQMEMFILVGELAHHEAGRSYCKVHSAMATMLSMSSIDIPAEWLKSPLPAFELRLRPGSPFEFEAILVHRLSTREGEALNIIGQRGLTRYPLLLEIEPGYTLEECLGKDRGTEAISHAECRVLTGLAISATLFIANQHELVLPDLKPREIELHRRQGTRPRTLPTKPGERMRVSLGAEIELPNPIRRYIDDQKRQPGGEGNPLTHSHLRRGHIRHQKCGPRENPEIKIVFVPPTVVRPDLPPPAQGPRYVIPDRLLPV